jgi:hypothetical protein
MITVITIIALSIYVIVFIWALRKAKKNLDLNPELKDILSEEDIAFNKLKNKYSDTSPRSSRGEKTTITKDEPFYKSNEPYELGILHTWTSTMSDPIIQEDTRSGDDSSFSGFGNGGDFGGGGASGSWDSSDSSSSYDSGSYSDSGSSDSSSSSSD